MKQGNETRQLGFTLIELVLSLIILGLVGAIGAVGFTDAVRGYLFGVDNANIAAKAQVALDRLTLELTHIDFWEDSTSTAKNGVTSSSKTALGYDVDFGDNRATGTGSLAYDASEGVLNLDTGFGDKILVDDVTDFELVYYTNPAAMTGASTYTYGQTMCIGITLELTGTNGKAITFNTRVVPMFNLPYAAPSS